MATSDWRGLYTVPEQDYGAQYTGRDDWMHPTNKKVNKFYRHRAYRGGSTVEPKPGLTEDYGASRLLMNVPETKVAEMKKYSTTDTFESDVRKAGSIFAEMRGIAENIQTGR